MPCVIREGWAGLVLAERQRNQAGLVNVDSICSLFMDIRHELSSGQKKSRIDDDYAVFGK